MTNSFVKNPHWIPDLVPWKQESGELWAEYERRLFNIYNKIYSQDPLSFDSKPLQFKKYPFDGIYPECFIHLTSCEQDGRGNGRTPDPMRSERIKWPKAVLDNYASCIECNYAECTKPLVWKYPWKNKMRIKFFLPNQSYLVILEQRSSYWLFITAYHIERRHAIDKLHKEYDSEYSHVIQ